MPVWTGFAEDYHRHVVPFTSLFAKDVVALAKPGLEDFVEKNSKRPVVLDVASGTGSLVRELFVLLGDGGDGDGVSLEKVIALEPAADMAALIPSTVAAAVQTDGNTHLQICNGAAEQIPLESDSVDFVFCVFGLSFFEDVRTAFSEIKRVLRKGTGRFFVCEWCEPSQTPAFTIMGEVKKRMAGETVDPSDPDAWMECAPTRRVEHVKKIAAEAGLSMTRCVEVGHDLCLPNFEAFWERMTKGTLQTRRMTEGMSPAECDKFKEMTRTVVAERHGRKQDEKERDQAEGEFRQEARARILEIILC